MSRVIYGARVSLEVGIIGDRHRDAGRRRRSGLLAGFYRGWIDTLSRASVDIVLSFPILLLAIGIAAACSVERLPRRH